MKQFLLLILTCTLFACNNPDGKTYPTDPVATGWDKGVQTYSEYVIIKPTWGQSFYFAFKSGYTFDFIVAIFLFIAGLFSLYKVATNRTKSRFWNTLSIVVGAVGIIGSLVFTFSQPGTVKWNNDIRIEKSYYDSHSNDLPALWDDLYSQQRIVGTSGK